jgi:hypothetical protein
MDMFEKPGNRQTDQLTNGYIVKGDFEPLVGREWSDKKGPGQETNFGGIALKPGSKFELTDDSKKIIIRNYGVWEL